MLVLWEERENSRTGTKAVDLWQMSWHRKESLVLLSVSLIIDETVSCTTNERSECQIQDWRNGKPRPHKDICGRPMDEEDIISASAATVTTSGYKPSPALLHQKSLLSQRPESDYLVWMELSWPFLILTLRSQIFMSPPTPDIGIIFYPSSGTSSTSQ